MTEAERIARAEAQRCRDVLAAFLISLTNGGKNRTKMLSINHDELVGLIARARALLTNGADVNIPPRPQP